MIREIGFYNNLLERERERENECVCQEGQMKSERKKKLWKLNTEEKSIVKSIIDI